MIRGLLKLVNSVIGLISLLVLLVIVVGGIWLYCNVTGTPSPLEIATKYDNSTISCMVQKSNLSGVDLQLWDETRDITRLSSDAVKEIWSNSQECVK